MAERINIIGANALQKYSDFQFEYDQNRTDNAINSVQKRFIKELLGTVLYNDVLNQIKFNNVSDSTKTLIDEYLIDILVNYTLSDLIPILAVSGVQGVNRIIPTNADGGFSFNDVSRIAKIYSERGKYFTNRASLYLLSNLELYPDYVNTTGKLDNVYPEGYTSPSPFLTSMNKRLP